MIKTLQQEPEKSERTNGRKLEHTTYTQRNIHTLRHVNCFWRLEGKRTRRNAKQVRRDRCSITSHFCLRVFFAAAPLDDTVFLQEEKKKCEAGQHRSAQPHWNHKPRFRTVSQISFEGPDWTLDRIPRSEYCRNRNMLFEARDPT